MPEWLVWIWEGYKIVCAVGVTVVGLIFLLYSLAFKEEIKDEREADREHIARSGGM